MGPDKPESSERKDYLPLRVPGRGVIKIGKAGHLIPKVEDVARRERIESRNNVLLILIGNAVDDYFSSGRLLRGDAAPDGPRGEPPMGDLLVKVEEIGRRTGITSRNNVLRILIGNAVDDYHETQVLMRTAPPGGVVKTTPEDLSGGGGGR